MDDHQFLAQRFETHRAHLRGVAYRMLGSLAEADDAVQEAWLRLSRTDAREVDNLGGWLTTVVGRVCLDMLRARKARPEDAVGAHVPETVANRAPPDASTTMGGGNPEQEAVLADSVGLALLVVLETLAPPERIAFVLHDLFGVSFEEIATIVDRSPAAARQLASRARRRVQGAPAKNDADLARQREVVGAFLAALRAGDLEALVAVLDPDLVVHADSTAATGGFARDVHGARDWAKQAIAFSRGAQAAHEALVDGAVGIVIAPRGEVWRVLEVTFVGDKIARIDVVGDPTQLREMEIGSLG
jgi:RNA polymerase sigma factor (sigma-70 family)